MRMPPRVVATLNRRFTNPAARSIAPWLPYLGTLEHVGRKSGKSYRTPLLVFHTEDGFVVLVGYGPESDWLKNVFAGGPTALRKRGGTVVALGESTADGQSRCRFAHRTGIPVVLSPLSLRRSRIGPEEDRP